MKKVTKTTSSSFKDSMPPKTFASSKTSHPRLIILGQQSIAPALQQQLAENGFEVMSLALPAKTTSVASQAIEDVFSEIAIYEWAIFANFEAVQVFFQGFFQHYQDLRSIGPMRFVSLSTQATDAIKTYRLEVELESTLQSDAVNQILEQASLENEKILLVGPQSTIEPIAQRLESNAYAIVDRYPYEQQHQSLTKLDLNIAEQFQKTGAHYMLFSSPESVDNFMHHARLFILKSTAQKPKTISLNPQTTQKLRQHQIPIDFELSMELNEAFAQKLAECLRA